jgi:hypothetical protein
MSTDSNSRYTPETDAGSSTNVSPSMPSHKRSENGKSYSLDQSNITVKHYAQLLLEKDKRVRVYKIRLNSNFLDIRVGV